MKGQKLKLIRIVAYSKTFWKSFREEAWKTFWKVVIPLLVAIGIGIVMGFYFSKFFK